MSILNLLSARGWFAGLLVIMVVVTVLFALIILLALKPVRKDGLNGEETQKLLKRREAELTSEILHNSNEQQKEELISKLREVQSAEKVVDELVDTKPAQAQPQAKDIKPEANVKPAETAEVKAEVAPAEAKPAEQKQEAKAEEAKTQSEKPAEAKPEAVKKAVKPAVAKKPQTAKPAKVPVKKPENKVNK